MKAEFHVNEEAKSDENNNLQLDNYEIDLKFDSKKKIIRIPVGMRIIKTTVAVMICLILGELLTVADYPPPAYACIAAVFATRDTIKSSVHDGIMRLLGAVLGGGAGILILFMKLDSISPYLNIIVISLGCMITITSCVQVKAYDAAPITCMVFLLVVLRHKDEGLYYAIGRSVETLAGIVVAILVNRFLDFGFIKNKSKR